MSATTELAFRHLLSQWNRHQDLRRSGAAIAELGSSRVELEDLRRNLRSLA